MVFEYGMHHKDVDGPNLFFLEMMDCVHSKLARSCVPSI